MVKLQNLVSISVKDVMGAFRCSLSIYVFALAS